MKKALIVIIVLAIIGAAAYYLTRNNSGSPAVLTPTPTASASKTPMPSAAKSTVVNVSIRNFSFNPDRITVKKGTKVTWTNNDNVPHTITSDLAVGNALNSSTIAPGQSYSFTFTDTGTFSYHCSIHPNMKGSVIVTN